MLLCQREGALQCLCYFFLLGSGKSWKSFVRPVESLCFRADTGDAQDNTALPQHSSNGVTQPGSSQDWRLGEAASLLCLLRPMCLCWSQLQSPCSCKEEISTRRSQQQPLESPDLTPVPQHWPSPSSCPAHATFSNVFSPAGALTSAFCTTNPGVHHIFALKLIIAAPQTGPEG